jgi:biopolymer transport protein TolQ
MKLEAIRQISDKIARHSHGCALAPKGYFMIKPIAAAILILAATPVIPLVEAPAFAQNAPPIAAPVGPQAESQNLAAPPGVINAQGGQGDAGAGGFSIVSMIRRADIVVQVVMGLLLLASLWSWTIIFSKIVLMSGLKRKARRFEKLFWSGQSLDELYQQFAAKNDHPMAAMFIAGLREWRRGFEGTGNLRESMIPGIKDRIEKAMSVTILRETDSIEKQLGMLATIGSVSPFVGLFGTVWGIMNSFSAIAARHDTTLAVVAPGIAEALFATAMGLLAAIPAVIFYNRFVADIGRYVNSLDAFADEYSAILSRQLDEKAPR